MLDPFCFDSDQEKCISQDGPQWSKLTLPEYQIYPYNCTGVIQTFNCGEKIYATGFLISSCLVLTSAHTFCYFGKKTHKLVEPKPASFYANIIGYLDPLKACKIVDFRICPKFKELMLRAKQLRIAKANLINSSLSDPQKQAQKLKIQQETYKVKKESCRYDYALLKIEKIVNREQFARVFAYNSSLQAKVDVGGYFKADNEFNIYHHSQRMYLENGAGYYAIDTESGQSGSPVLLQNSPKGQIIGIHKGYDRDRKLNVCTLVTEEIISQLLQWAKQFRIDSVNFVPYRHNPSSILYYQEQEQSSKLNKVQVQNEDLKVLVTQLMNQNTTLRENAKKFAAESASLKTVVEILQSQLKQLQGKKQPVNLSKPKQAVEGIGYFGNPHNSQFEISGNLTKFSIKKRGQDKNHYLFAKAGQIPKNKVISFKIRQVNTFARHVFTGIATKNAFGIANAPLYSSQCVTYDAKYGQIWQNTRKRGGFTKINDNQVITLVINTKQWQLKWKLGAKQIVSADIPEKLRKEPIYLALLLNWDQDTVEVQQQPLIILV